MERPCCDIGHGLGCGGFYRKPPGSKIEAGPGKLSALEKGIFARTEFFLGNKAAGEQAVLPKHHRGPSLLPGCQAAAVYRPNRSLKPEQQRKKEEQPGPEPTATEKRPQNKKEPTPLFCPQPHPVLAGKPGQPPIPPCCTLGRKSAGTGKNPREVEPFRCSCRQQALRVAVLSRKADPGPQQCAFHP